MIAVQNDTHNNSNSDKISIGNTIIFLHINCLRYRCFVPHWKTQTNKQNDKQFKGRLVHWVVWVISMAKEEEAEAQRGPGGRWGCWGEEGAITRVARQMALLHHKKTTQIARWELPGFQELVSVVGKDEVKSPVLLARPRHTQIGLLLFFCSVEDKNRRTKDNSNALERPLSVETENRSGLSSSQDSGAVARG